MFRTIEQQFERHVVVPDLHGEHEVAEKVIHRYIEDSSIGFVFLGDLIDKKGVAEDPEKGVRRTIELLRQLGDRAILTIANHEFYLLASALSSGQQQRSAHRSVWIDRHVDRTQGLTSIEQNTMSSYDITNDGHAAVDSLWRDMRAHGHTKVLTSATPYYETDTFVAVHAGLRYDQDLDQQKEDLDTVASLMASGIFTEMPEQWFSIELAVDARVNSATDKTIVSGHAHYRVPTGRYNDSIKEYSSDRSIHEGRRIRLASQLNAPIGEPLYVWQDWDGRIVRITR